VETCLLYLIRDKLFKIDFVPTAWVLKRSKSVGSQGADSPGLCFCIFLAKKDTFPHKWPRWACLTVSRQVDR